MKTVKYNKGIAIAIIVGIIVVFMGFKKSSNSDLSDDDTPLYSQSLKSSVEQLERKGAQSDSGVSYSISGKIDSINSGIGLKGIVVVLTATSGKSVMAFTTSGYTCGATCSGSTYCGSACPTINSTTCTGSTYCGSKCPTINTTTCSGSTYCGSACPTINTTTCSGSTYCGSKCPTINSTTCSGSTYCGSKCPTINSTTCEGSTYCGSKCPTINGTTCAGTTYCGSKCPTINQVTCYNTCNAATCSPGTFVKYDTTDINGNYSFEGLNAGDYIVTPADTIYKFIPENQTVNIIAGNSSDINFATLFNEITSVHELKQPHFDLVKVHPNPFTNSTEITYELYETKSVIINIYSLNGTLVKNFVSQQLMPGSYNFKWKPTNCESGIYTIELKVGNTKLAKKVIYKK